MPVRMNHEARNARSAGHVGHGEYLREQAESRNLRLPVTPQDITYYQGLLAEIKAHPEFNAPAYLPKFEAELARGLNFEHKRRKIAGWRVALGFVKLSPADEARSRARRRDRVRALCRAGISKDSMKIGLQNLEAVQAARPLKPPGKK